MCEIPAAGLDAEAFRRVWRRVMPQDRPDCPFTLEPPQPPAAELPWPMPAASVCLGEGSAGETPILTRFLALTEEGRRAYGELLRRRGGRGREPVLACLAEAKGKQRKRLSAALFLITGEEGFPSPSPVIRWESFPLALRERYRAEQETALACAAAAAGTPDLCLSELYRSLAAQDWVFAGKLRGRLEELQGL